MIIFISPSKTFTNTIISGKEILFKDKTNYLFNQIKKIDKTEFKAKFNLSDKLTNEVYNYYHVDSTLSQAIYRYGGVLYKALNPSSLNFKDNKIYILSAMYGLLESNTAIKKYRMDFTYSMLGNLYSYWKEDLSNYMNNSFKNEILIDLTSKEFEDLIIKPKYRIDFKLIDKNISTVLLKQMRGNFAREIVNQNLNSIDDIKSLNVEGFKYNESLSNEFELIFSKE